VKAVTWIESLEIVGSSSFAAEFPAEKSRPITTRGKSLTAQVDSILFLKAHLLIYSTISILA
jgi:hypothetical protein